MSEAQEQAVLEDVEPVENQEPVDPAPEPAAEQVESPAPEDRPYWPDDWRERIADHASAGNKDVYQKELRRLQRFTDPSAIFGQARELESRFSSGGLVKLPTEKSSDKEWADYRAAIGVPDKPEGYLENIKLANGIEIGEADKPFVNGFAEALHQVGAPPQVAESVLNWYYSQQEQAAADLDDMDAQISSQAEQILREEFGPAFRRMNNAIATVFSQAPGGADINNPDALISRLLSGRTADGVLIGSDPDFFRFMANIAKDRGLGMTEVEMGDETGQGVMEEIKAIEKMMREDRRAYFKDKDIQNRYVELLEARSRINARK